MLNWLPGLFFIEIALSPFVINSPHHTQICCSVCEVLHTILSCIWVDEDGIEPFTEHRKEKGKKSTGPVPAQVQQSEDPPEMVSIFVKEKKMERKIIEIVN